MHWITKDYIMYNMFFYALHCFLLVTSPNKTDEISSSSGKYKSWGRNIVRKSTKLYKNDGLIDVNVWLVSGIFQCIQCCKNGYFIIEMQKQPMLSL